MADRKSALVLQRLAETKGSIVDIASMNATVALPRIPACCASRGGVAMLPKRWH